VTGLIATAIALGLVVVLAVITARGPAPGTVPDVLTEWGSLNTGRIEDAVRAALGGTDARDPALLELARHHAFDRALRDYAGERSPEGEDHAGRRTRLAPTYVGTSVEWNIGFVRERGTREEEVAAQAIALLPPESLTPTAQVEVGAAVEAGNVAVTVLRGRRVATLSHPPFLGVSGGLWTLRGMLATGVAADAIEARMVRGTSVADGVARSALHGDGPDDPDAPLPFVLELTLPDGADPVTIELLVGDDVVLSVPVRT